MAALRGVRAYGIVGGQGVIAVLCLKEKGNFVADPAAFRLVACAKRCRMG